jgi:FMN phosphatase YigB (HAD superfamily)
LALDRLGVKAEEAAFVAGSGYDMFGTSAVGLRTYWHNRVGLALPQGAPTPELQAATLAPALPWLQSFSK